MKKIISILFAITLLFSCFGLTSFAQNSSLTISEDYKTITVDGKTYSQFNSNMLASNNTMDRASIQVMLSTAQQNAIDGIHITSDYKQIMFGLQIAFKDGISVSISYLRSDLLADYNNLVNNGSDSYDIVFDYPESNTIVADSKALYGTEVNLTADFLYQCDYFPVTVSNINNSISVIKGSLLIGDNAYYYVDFANSGIAFGNSFSPWNYANLKAYKITDSTLLEKLETAYDAYYYGDFSNGFTQTLAAIFLIFTFGIIPLGILIVGIILAIRSKKVYKKLFRMLYIVAAAELVVFTIITMCVIISQ